MTISNFIPALWAAAVQEPFLKSFVWAQPSVANRKYEGVLTQMGQSVNITSISDPTVSAYTKGSGITIQELSDTTLALAITQGDYFAFHVQDIDKVQAAGNFEDAGLFRAGIGLKDKMDQYIAGQPYSSTLTANQLGHATVVNGGTGVAGSGQSLAYNLCVQLREQLDTQSVPQEGRYVIVPPKFISGLLLDNRFIRVNEAGTDTGLRNGIVGRVSGMDVLVSNNLRTVAQSLVLNAGGPAVGATVNGTVILTGDQVIVAGVPDAFTVAQQLVETEALRDTVQFADIVRGLNIYGSKVTHPEGLATVCASFAAGTG